MNKVLGTARKCASFHLIFIKPYPTVYEMLLISNFTGRCHFYEYRFQNQRKMSLLLEVDLKTNGYCGTALQV